MNHRNIFYYDSRDNLTCVRDPDLGLTYYTYDAGSRMTSVKNPFGEVTYYAYRLDGQVSKKTLGNGCVTYYEFDAIGRTTKVDNRKGDMSVISSFAYERDAVGNPLSIEREDGYTVYYDYDARHQLTAERHLDGGEVYAWEWDYDAAGNREYQVFNGEATYYEYNAANELLTETTGGETTYYDYDACGNTTAKQEPTGVTYYHWDHENLMTRLDLPDGGHSYFAYDADSKRVSKRDSEGFTEFIYQGPDMLALQMERDEAGETRVRYTMGAGLEAMRRADGGDISSGDSSFYHFDWLGSTFELTDESQAVTDEYLHNAWGEVLQRTGTTDNPHQWVGKERYYRTWVPSLCLLGMRCYRSPAGRFLTRDPFRSRRKLDSVIWQVLLRSLTLSALAQGHEVNHFVYPKNPASVIDPWGLWDMNTIHYEKTRVWARDACAWVKRGGGWVRATAAEAEKMAAESRDVDKSFPPVWPPYFEWHFDWPPGGVDSRNVLFGTKYVEAELAGGKRSGCIRSAKLLGQGLHPLQDYFSHGVATPFEHLLNSSWMDDPSESSRWTLSRTVPYLSRHPSPAWDLNYNRPRAREFNHYSSPGRIWNTEEATCSAVRAWLKATCCGEYVIGGP